MQGLLILAALVAIWKLSDTAVTLYQMHLSALIESWKIEKGTEPEEEQRAIGFDNYGDTRRKIEEEYEDED